MKSNITIFCFDGTLNFTANGGFLMNSDVEINNCKIIISDKKSNFFQISKAISLSLKVNII
jgi:hypothetical protein